MEDDAPEFADTRQVTNRPGVIETNYPRPNRMLRVEITLLNGAKEFVYTSDYNSLCVELSRIKTIKRIRLVS